MKENEHQMATGSLCMGYILYKDYKIWLRLIKLELCGRLCYKKRKRL